MAAKRGGVVEFYSQYFLKKPETPIFYKGFEAIKKKGNFMNLDVSIKRVKR